MNEWMSLLASWLPFLVLIGLWFWLSRRSGMQARPSDKAASDLPPCQAPLQKYSAFPKFGLSYIAYCRHPVPSKGRCARHETRGGMRWTRMVPLTGAPEADGKDVWAWHLDAGVKFALRRGRRWPTSPKHRGEHVAAVKTIAWGMPGVSGVTCGDYARVLCFFIVREAAGASSARHSLRPFFGEDGKNKPIPRATTCGENVKPRPVVVTRESG